MDGVIIDSEEIQKKEVSSVKPKPVSVVEKRP